MNDRELPRYKCHKEVCALKIRDVQQAPADTASTFEGGDWLLIPEDSAYGPIAVGHNDFYLKHRPFAGGYYVVYDDGYASFSPAKAFEEGYTRL